MPPKRKVPPGIAVRNARKNDPAPIHEAHRVSESPQGVGRIDRDGAPIASLVNQVHSREDILRAQFEGRRKGDGRETRNAHDVRLGLAPITGLAPILLPALRCNVKVSVSHGQKTY